MKTVDLALIKSTLEKCVNLSMIHFLFVFMYLMIYILHSCAGGSDAAGHNKLFSHKDVWSVSANLMQVFEVSKLSKCSLLALDTWHRNI